MNIDDFSMDSIYGELVQNQHSEYTYDMEFASNDLANQAIKQDDKQAIEKLKEKQFTAAQFDKYKDELDEWLNIMIELGGSDLHLRPNFKVSARLGSKDIESLYDFAILNSNTLLKKAMENFKNITENSLDYNKDMEHKQKDINNLQNKINMLQNCVSRLPSLQEYANTGNNIKDRYWMLNLAKAMQPGDFPKFIANKSLDFSYDPHTNGRDTFKYGYTFRVNIFFTMEGACAVFRAIPSNIKSIEDLGLPLVIKRLVGGDKINNGLILVTGPTGSGKSTTLASMIDCINKKYKKHIITIEDPIEFKYKSEKCIINQRGVGQDTLDFKSALRAALREDPDIILIGEMRDLETIEIALHAAETGHLVLSTLHTIDAQETINRILGMFPSSDQNRIRSSFAGALVAIVSQRLIPKKDVPNESIAAIEILQNNSAISSKILEGKEHDILDVIKSYSESGMQDFDSVIAKLYKEHKISKEAALSKATNSSNLARELGAIELSDPVLQMEADELVREKQKQEQIENEKLRLIQEEEKKRLEELERANKDKISANKKSRVFSV